MLILMSMSLLWRTNRNKTTRLVYFVHSHQTEQQLTQTLRVVVGTPAINSLIDHTPLSLNEGVDILIYGSVTQQVGRRD